MLLRTTALALALAALVGMPAQADDYPSRPITIVSPLPPGGSTDIAARILAAAMEKELKSPVVVESKVGAAGAVGAAYVANAKPDGYTLMFTQNSVILIPAADKLFGRQSAYSVDKFIPIARMASEPLYLVVRSDSPYKTFQEFLKDVKDNPGKRSFVASGLYGSAHAGMEILVKEAGLKMRHLPVTGAGPGVTALLGGNADVGVVGTVALDSQVKASKMRALAALAGHRSKEFPDVPATAEFGLPVDYVLWQTLFAPAQTPQPILDKLDAAARKALKTPEVREQMANIKLPVDVLAGAELQEFFAQDQKRVADIFQFIGKSE